MTGCQGRGMKGLLTWHPQIESREWHSCACLTFDSYTAGEILARKCCRPLWVDLPPSTLLTKVILHRLDLSLTIESSQHTKSLLSLVLQLWSLATLNTSLAFLQRRTLSLPATRPELSPPRMSPLLFSLLETLFARLVF